MPEQTAASILLAALAEISRRVDTLHDSMGEIKAEIVAVSLTGQKTLDQATRTNGRLSKVESRLDEHDEFHLDRDAELRGRKAQRADDLARLDIVTTIFDRYWKYAVMVALAGALILDLGWQMWGARPW